MTTKYAREKGAAADELFKLLKPGDTVWTVCRHVTQSGMTRHLEVFIIRDDAPYWLTSKVADVTGFMLAKRRPHDRGLVIGGVGLDVGFEVVYRLGRALYPDGFKLTRNQVGRNGDQSGYDKDGGYAFRHRWL